MIIPIEVMANNFNQIDHDGWKFRMNTPWGLKDYSHQVISSDNGYPARYGRKSERFDVRPGDCGATRGRWSDCENDRERSEMTSGHDLLYYSGDEYWYRWSLFIPKHHTNLWKVKVSYAEFFAKGCGPTFQILEAIYGRGPELVLHFPYSNRYPNARVSYPLTTDYVGKWLDLVINVKWSSGNDGELKIWVNNDQKMDYKGKTTHCHEGVYFKYGVYRSFVSRNWKSSEIATVAYYDGIRISRNGDGMFEELAE